MDDVEDLGLAPKLILGGIAVFVILTVIGWVIGAVLAVLRLIALVAIVVAVIWAIGASRARR